MPHMEQDIKRTTAIVIACGAVMVFISMGTRQSFGLFLQPVTLDLAVGREVFSLAIALQNLLFDHFFLFTSFSKMLESDWLATILRNS